MAMTLRLTEEEQETLRRRAQRESRSMQDVARQAVREYVENHGYLPPPDYIRDQNTLLRDERTKGPAYKYPHDFEGGWVDQRYLPEGVPGNWYNPKRNGYEERIAEFMKRIRDKKRG